MNKSNRFKFLRHASTAIRVISLAILVYSVMPPAYASNTFLVRKTSQQDYANAMADLQSRLMENGFKIKFVQRVDIGLAKAGYHTDRYRIVFFMPKKGVEKVLTKRTDLADLFPLKVTVYREKGKVYVLAAQTANMLDPSVPADIKAYFIMWDKHLNNAVNNMF